MLNNLERTPLLTVLTVFFILGILLGNFTSIPLFVLLAFCLLAVVFAFLKLKQGLVFGLALSLLCLGLGALHSKNYLRLPRNHIARLGIRNINPARLAGVIDSDPAYAARKVSFIFRVTRVTINEQSHNIQGKILVNVAISLENAARLSYGDELILEGNLYKPFHFGAQANFSYRDYLRNQGIYYLLNVKKENEIVFLGRGRGGLFQSLAFKLKHSFKNIFEQYLWPINSRVLSGIILGERQNIPEDIRQAFVQTGTAHIIAISGFNVGIVACIVLILLKALRIKRKARYCLTIPILMIHMLAVGASSSVVRATIMAVIMLIAYLIGREAHITNSLSLAALIILGYNPLQIFDAGFQLSFVSVLGIVLLSPKLLQGFAALTRLILERIKKISFKREFIPRGQKTAPFRARMNFGRLGIPPKACPAGRWAGEPRALARVGSIHLLRVTLNGFSVSLSAWLVTLGFIAYYFRVIAPVTILANLIIVPWTSLVIILGFALGLSAIICPVLAVSIASTTNFALGLLFKMTFGLSRLPFAYFYLPVN